MDFFIAGPVRSIYHAGVIYAVGGFTLMGVASAIMALAPLAAVLWWRVAGKKK